MGVPQYFSPFRGFSSLLRVTRLMQTAGIVRFPKLYLPIVSPYLAWK